MRDPNADIEPFTISQVVFSAVRVRGDSEWVFVEISDPDGYTGAAEITGPDAATRTARALAGLADELRGEGVRDERDLAASLDLPDTLLRRDQTLATALSAMRSAILDGQARRAGLSLTEMLGGRPTPHVALYANINRALLPDDRGPVDRSPAAFGETAARARDDGFQTFKCAPFDECRAPFASRGLPDEARPGLERIAAARRAIGPDLTLLVDCHSRFDLESALALEAELHALGAGWFEEPLDPLRYPQELARLRAVARMPLAGAEHGYGEPVFTRLVGDGALDVVMPDVKYCGGVGEAARVGQSLESARPGAVSLHSPSGPISLLASAHATAAFGGALPLEHAIAEAPWRATVVEPAERVENGSLLIPPGPGLGACLNQAFISEQGRRWTV